MAPGAEAAVAPAAASVAPAPAGDFGAAAAGDDLFGVTVSELLGTVEVCKFSSFCKYIKYR